MTDSSRPEEVDTFNERSLSTLLRAITLSERQFALILVRCNYIALQERMRHRLQELCDRPLLEIVLPQTIKTLFTTITNAIATAEAVEAASVRDRCEALSNELEEESDRSYSSSSTQHLQNPVPKALMVFGLESVTAIDRVLISTNQVRDEFRKNLTFPLVLWVTDEVLVKIARFAPDFKSWAAASIKFELSTDESIALWRQTTGELLATVLNTDVGQFLPNLALDLAPSCRRRQELEFARKDLQTRGVSLEPSLVATRQFLLGRDAYTSDRIDSAIAHYLRSLIIGQESSVISQEKSVCTGEGLWRGVLLFHIGLCCYRKAELQPAARFLHWQEARNYFQQAVAVFEEQKLPDLVAESIGHLGEILRHLEAWTDLQTLAKAILTQPQTHNNRARQAQAYGFLAEVAFSESNWMEACDLASTALCILAESTARVPQHRASYLKILASSERRLGLVEMAVNHLELAKEEIGPQVGKLKPQASNQLYLDILEELRSLHFEQGHVGRAFQLKQEQRSIRQQYGFSTFVGAVPLGIGAVFLPQMTSAAHSSLTPGWGMENGEEFNSSPITDRQFSIANSRSPIPNPHFCFGRQQDVNRLIERLSRNDHKLTVIHGASGVGKSSLIEAGLIPALKDTILGAREATPVVLRAYTDWVGELGRRLAASQSDPFGRGDFQVQLDPGNDRQIPAINASPVLGDELQDSPKDTSDRVSTTPQSIIERLRQNAERNLLTVLIFDQFEEFFFVCTDRADRQQFYDFFRDCLNLPFVKVILSLREDYLHYLLECDRECHLDAINNNILHKDMRYYLQDLSPQDATSVINSLTKRSQLYLEPALVEAFVRDLAAQKGAVRLIELQVVGAQLQAENIKTLEQYQQLGDSPIGELVKRSLLDVITDCGSENEDAVWSVLFSLTNERGTRPLKTKPELIFSYSSSIASNIQIINDEELKTDDKLDLILNILLGSGLALRVPEEPYNRYQLVHDYLVEPIREAYEWRAQLNAAAEIAIREQELSRVRKQKLRAVSAGILMAILAVAAGVFAWRAEAERKRAFVAETNAQLSALSASSEALFVSNKHFDALLEALRAARLRTRAARVKPETGAMVVTTLEQSVYSEKERNRLEGHTDVVWHVSFSPDGKTLASSSRDKTVIVWRQDGTNLVVLTGHDDSVTSASFSPNGKTIASASWDKTVRLWRRDGHMLKILRGHKNHVLSVSFSPDGTNLASASVDGTVKLWTVEGELIKTLRGHQGAVTAVSFSPDGKTIASGGEDKTVKLWDRSGKLLKTLTDHNGKVNYVSFSLDGQTIASASDDKTVKLWDRNGKLLKTLRGHQNWIFAVSFNRNGEMASASEDNTVRIWSRSGTLIKTLPAHSDGVTGVSFSPDGESLASASYDKTVKLWKLTNTSRTILKEHTDRVTDVSFSPDGRAIASASNDKTVKLWKLGTENVKNATPSKQQAPILNSQASIALTGHGDRIDRVNFSFDGQLIASASRDKTIKLWNRNGKLIKTLIGHKDWVLDVKFSPDGQLIASASRDKTVKLWSRNGKLIKTLLGHGDRVNAVAFSPDGSLLASASDDKTVKLWNSAGRLLQTLKGHGNWVLDVSFNSEGLLLASAGYDNTVKLWRRIQGEFVSYRSDKTLRGPTDSVARVSFSPDGHILATTSWDNRVQLWRLDDTLIKNLEGHSDRVTSASFSPDGKIIASASEDGTVILWNLDLDDLMERSCSWLHDYLETNPKVKPSDRNLCDIN